MATTTLKSLSYRKFDDLMNEVYLDLASYTREGMVEPGQLIKIAQRVNQELGLKINGTKETILDVENGHAKLPSDFYQLNLALLCYHGVVYEKGLFSGLHTETVVTTTDPNITTCPCWTVDATTSSSLYIKYCDGTTDTVTVNEGSTRFCAISITVQSGTASVVKGNFCYNNPDTGQFSCDKPSANCDCNIVDGLDMCNVINADPWKQNKVFTTCDNTQQVNIIETHSTHIKRWKHFEKLYMVPSKDASSFCLNSQFKNAPHTGEIRNGFLYVPTLRGTDNEDSCGKVYICYLGAMEDEEGNLLVLDHPKINEFYEYALKERIFENLYLNGEPDIERRLNLVQEKLRRTRAECLSLVCTPDFYELDATIKMNRKAMYNKYLHPFSSLYSNTPGWPWALNTDKI